MCSITITVITPMAKPLPTKGCITSGAIPLGISWKSIATMMGRPSVRASANVVAERVDGKSDNIRFTAGACHLYADLFVFEIVSVIRYNKVVLCAFNEFFGVVKLGVVNA